MPAMSVGGLASGLDTNSIISQLTALEQAKVTREVKKQDTAKSTLEKFKELESKLLSLQTKAKGLELPKDFNMFKSSSNYEDYATVTGGEGATSGQYDLVVYQLATSQKVASKSFDAINKSMADLSLMGATDQPVSIFLSTSTAAQKADPTSTKKIEIKINSSDTLKDIVNKINAAEGSGVKASIMTMSSGENKLILTAVDTGTKGFSISADGGSPLLQKLGILSNSDGSEALSGNAFLTKDGAATEDTTFDKLNTTLLKEIKNTDSIGVYVNGSWITASVDAGSGAQKGTLGAMLSDLNSQLSAHNLEAKLNDSGEIVLTSTDNFAAASVGAAGLSGIKVVIGDYNSADPTDPDSFDVKRDLGKFTQKNTFENEITKAQNAFYTVDGISFNSQSNDDDKVVNGSTFNLKKADPDKVIRVSLESDTSGIADKIEEFVKEYNELLKFIDENAKASVQEVEETDERTGKKTKVSRRVAGVFSGDFGISSLRENLRSMMSGIIKELSNPATLETYNYSTNQTDKTPNPKYTGFYTVYSSASRVGIVANKEGYYDVDKEKLTKALNADFEGVRKLFTSGGFSDTPGFSVGRFTKESQPGVYVFDASSQKWYLNPERDKDGKYLFLDPQNKIEDVKGTWVGNSVFTTKNGLSIELPNTLVDAQVTFSRGIASQLSSFVEKAKTGYYNEDDKYVKGYFERSKITYQDRIDEMQKRIDQLQKRVDSYNDRLVRQFTSLEKAMSNLQAQSANMLSALGSVSTGKK